MPIAKQRSTEDELVRRIHRAVGGPAKLSTYEDPAAVRKVVILALANEQQIPAEAQRIAKGDLSVFERRVVRTVTNRGAAVRSRMRQRKELARLRDELNRKDQRLRQLEAALQAVTANFPNARLQLPASAPVSPVSPPIPDSGASSHASDIPSCDAGLAMPNPAPFHALPDTQVNGESVDRALFGSLVDQLIQPL